MAKYDKADLERRMKGAVEALRHDLSGAGAPPDAVAFGLPPSARARHDVAAKPKRPGTTLLAAGRPSFT